MVFAHALYIQTGKRRRGFCTLVLFIIGACALYILTEFSVTRVRMAFAHGLYMHKGFCSLMLFIEFCSKGYSRSPCTREISHNFVMMRPISKFQRPADCALRVGSKYTFYILLTYTFMEIAVCPVSVVHTFFSLQNMPMTYAYELWCAMLSHKY